MNPEVGTISKYFNDKQFGFLRSTCHEKDIFFHRKKQTIALADIVTGQQVTFTLVSDPKGPAAVGMAVTDGGCEQDAQSPLCIGTVLRYCPQGEFGFVETEDKRELFFSFVSSRETIAQEDLLPGVIVSYRPTTSRQGKCASELALVDSDCNDVSRGTYKRQARLLARQ